MSLSQYAIFLYTSSHTVTVSASRILGMNLVTPGSSWISITTSWEVQKHRHQFLISPINSSPDYFPLPFLRSTLNKCEAARFRCGFVMHALFHPRADLHLLWAILTNSLRCALDTAGRFKLLSNSRSNGTWGTLPRDCSWWIYRPCCVFKPAVPGRGASPGRRSRGKGGRWADWPAIWTELSSRAGSRTPRSRLWDCSVSLPADTTWWLRNFLWRRELVIHIYIYIYFFCLTRDCNYMWKVSNFLFKMCRAIIARRKAQRSLIRFILDFWF